MPGKRFELLYRASRDGDSAQAFHEKCDNQGPTITFVAATTRAPFAAYTPDNWTSPTDYEPFEDTPKNFTFDLVSGRRQICHGPGIFRHAERGPCFAYRFCLWDPAIRDSPFGDHWFVPFETWAACENLRDDTGIYGDLEYSEFEVFRVICVWDA